MRFFSLLLLCLFLTSFSRLSAQDAPADPFDFVHQDTMRNTDFSFWIGEWDVYQTGTEKLVGKSRIEAILDGQVIRESYFTPKGGYKGTSLNAFNQTQNRWEQYWVDNGGLVLHIVGGLQDGKMVLSDCSDKKQNCSRITWTPLPDDRVRQIWDQSKDGGRSWTNAFDGTYVRGGR